MGQSTGVYSLGVFGLTTTQRMVLSSLCKLSRSRAAVYALSDDADPRSADIAIVDSDDADAFRRWQNAPIARGLPVVFVSSQPLTDLKSNQYNLLRSRLSGSLLQLLDRIATNEFGHESPVVINDATSSSSQRALAGSTEAGSPRATALVIDDSISARTQIGLCLEKLNVVAKSVEDASQGLQQLQERRFDMVFLDVILPDMDGYQVCKLIKKDPITKSVPVIMLTSKGSAINKLQGSIAGCDHYLVKPVSESEVSKVVKDFLPAKQYA